MPIDELNRLPSAGLDRATFLAALADPEDSVACFALADQALEAGHETLALAWRFMGKMNVRPAVREGARIRNPFGFYVSGAHTFMKHDGLEMKRLDANDHSVVPRLLMTAMGYPFQWMCLFKTHEQAVLRLGAGLLKMKEVMGEI